MELVNPLYKVINETPPSAMGSLKTPLELDTSGLDISIITSVMISELTSCTSLGMLHVGV